MTSETLAPRKVSVSRQAAQLEEAHGPPAVAAVLHAQGIRLALVVVIAGGALCLEAFADSGAFSMVSTGILSRFRGFHDPGAAGF